MTYAYGPCPECGHPITLVADAAIIGRIRCATCGAVADLSGDDGAVIVPRPRRMGEVYALQCGECDSAIELPTRGGAPRQCPECGAPAHCEWPSEVWD